MSTNFFFDNFSNIFEKPDELFFASLAIIQLPRDKIVRTLHKSNAHNDVQFSVPFIFFNLIDNALC